MSFKSAKFEIFKDDADEYRFRLKAPNGKVIAVSEGYKNRQNVLTGIYSVQNNADRALIVDIKE